ncbi:MULTISPECIES: polysaccharide biosynthesis/export family protein [Sinorhizobium]|uniref:polysaccharide biosynthesis/export family protein n=1 Tax=Sinorhizobium TaxID=28105 RepID=UPI00055E1C9A|nr:MULTISPECIES: polysaccharide biosynthesis/export family protein [Sinorhizobium]PDT52904.1 sugar ABC transporter substrate-binding protein [Sinorhizobium sp. NG07B]POH29075.1 sugar ABC transporter substrate-binding protein [Sinorhizobium americanum]
MGTLPPLSATSLSLRVWGTYFLAIVLLAVGLVVGPAPPASASDYRLNAGDVLTFDFLDDAELPITATVSGNGEAQFPLIGGVNVVGLTITEAIEKLGSEYRRRDILVDPKLSLNISTFRPIFVLGEVRSPGSFPFYSGLTVEQAIGLAGGMQVVTANASDRLIVRARLRAEIEAAKAEIVHEAVYAARLAAQLKSSEKVDLKDVPEVARTHVEELPVDGVIELEEKILKEDLAAYRSQAQILTEGIAQAEGGIEILNELVQQQKDIVSNSVDDVARVGALRQRGLNTESELSRAENSAATEKAQLLETFATLARTRQEMSELKLQLAKLAADRKKDILTQLQEREIAIKKLIAEQRSAEEQILLLAAVARDESKKNQISYAYEVRRSAVGGKPTSLQASLVTELLPGDVVVVSIAGM